MSWNSKSCVLSIDWDFWARQGTDPFQWDWGFKEAPFFREHIWTIRALGFAAQGIDIRDEMSLSYSNVQPLDFVPMLQRAGYTFSAGVPVVVSDSHLFGFFSAREGNHHLVQFDAHHDLGYSSPRDQKRMLDSGKLECGSWLYTALHRNKNLTVTQLYPSWKGLFEIERTSPTMKRSKRVKFDVFDEKTAAKEARHVCRVHIARSSAWSPPWLDAKFLQFVESFDSVDGTTVVPFEEDEHVNPLKLREFDYDYVLKQAAFEKEAMLKLQALPFPGESA